MATLQVPVLFDMSGDTIVFGEAAGADFVSSHLEFTLDMTTAANDISLNAADLSGSILVGDHETSDGIFFSSDLQGSTTGISAIDRLCDRISNAITRGKLVHVPKTGNHSNSGIPMGGRALRNATGTVDNNAAMNIYSPKYNTSIAPIGDEQMLGQAMGRVACVHLVGHPLSAAMFSDPTQIQVDVETDSDQTYLHNSGNVKFYNALAVQLSKVLGGSRATNPLNGGKQSSGRTYTTGRLRNNNRIDDSNDPDGNQATPLSFIIQEDLEVGDKIQIIYNSNTINATITNVLTNGGEKNAIETDWTHNDNSFPAVSVIVGNTGPILDASGVSNIALKSVFEQLMNVPGRSQIMESRDVTGQPENSLTTVTGGFPVIPGDKLVLFIRPKIQFASQTEAVESTVLQGFPNRMTFKDLVTPYNVGAQGTITGQVYSESGSYNGAAVYTSNNSNTPGINPAFDGVVTGTYGWLSPKTYADNYDKGDYVGTVQTTLAQGGVVAGEWIQVNVGQKVGVSEFTIVPHNKAGALNSIGGRSPYQFRLLKSNNGIAWKIVDRITVGTSNTDTSNYSNNNTTSATKIDKTFTLPNPEVGQYWRLVVEKIYQKTIGDGGNIDGAAAIQELILTGAKFPSEIDIHSDKAAPTEAAIFDISGVQTNVAAIAADISTVFPGNAITGSASEESKWGWMGSANSDTVSLETTDENDVRTIDLHIWKITVTL
tara:strand:+ start:136 stop:2277 length:2142 start_codon:yes stop_codon:yes gene_type:complete